MCCQIKRFLDYITRRRSKMNYPLIYWLRYKRDQTIREIRMLEERLNRYKAELVFEEEKERREQSGV